MLLSQVLDVSVGVGLPSWGYSNQTDLLIYTAKHAAFSGSALVQAYRGPGGGGGHCLFEGSYPLPNYRPRFSGLYALSFL